MAISSRFYRKCLITNGLLTALVLCTAVLVQGGQFQDTLRLKGASPNPESPVEFTATLRPVENKPQEVVLEVAAKIPPRHYIYSTTQTNGAETKITLERPQGLQPIESDFQPDHAPKKERDVGFDNQEVVIEKFFDHVTWTRRFKLLPGVKPQDVSIDGQIKYQVCNDSTCRLPDPFAFHAKLAVSESHTADSYGNIPNDKSVPNVEDVKDTATTTFEHKVGRRGNQQTAAEWTVSIQPRQAKPGDEVTLSVDVKLQPGWHVYALDQKQLADGQGPLETAIKLESIGNLQPIGPFHSRPDPLAKKSDAWEGLVERYHEGHTVWKQMFKVPESAAAGDITLDGSIGYQMCNSVGCQPPTGFTFQGKLTVAGRSIAAALPLSVTGQLNIAQASELIESVRELASAATPLPESATGAAVVVGAIDKSQGLMLFLLAAVSAGFLALLTPCVFPMIPITVSFFQKQSEKEHHRPVTMASVYCLGIIGTFTGLGLLMSVFYGPESLNILANNSWMNVFIAAVLVFFAMNLLGLFDIRMPSWLLTYTSGQESRGGFIGVLFMALTFTLTSFTCTFAFAGVLLAAASKGDRLWPILGLLAFSAAFSLPFFFLALFPSFLKKLPKSGGWMNVVKVLMGLVELGAAFKFFSVADQNWHPEGAWLFSYELVIASWMTILATAGLYLLGLFRTPHDTPIEHVGAVRLTSAMGSLALAAYFAVGLFATNKPKGKLWEFVDAFATPRFEGGADPTGPFLKHGDLKYALDFESALKFAVDNKMPVFLDFTGVNCVNCRKMEQGPMSKPDVEEKLKRFVRVQLFTDTVPFVPDPQERERLVTLNRKIQTDWFGDVTLPAYVIIPPDPKILTKPDGILASFLGFESKDGAFSQFLDDGLSKWQKLAAAQNAPRLTSSR